MEWLFIFLGLFIAIVLIFSSTSSNKKNKPNKSPDIRVFKTEEDYRKSDIYLKNIKKCRDVSEIIEKQISISGDRSKLVGCFNIAIKGLYYRAPASQRRATELHIHEELFLERELYNSYDPYAITVKTCDNYQIGYVDSAFSKRICNFINQQFEIYCFLSKSKNDSIPYQYMDVYYIGDDPDYDPEKIERQRNAKRIKMAMQRAQDTINSTDKEHLKQKAIERLESLKAEILEIEKKRVDSIK